MAIFKSYSEFVNESFFPDEISKLGKRALGAIKKFIGKGANFLNSLVYQSTGKKSNDGAAGTIPNGVYIFPSATDIAELEKAGIEPIIPDLQELYGKEETLPPAPAGPASRTEDDKEKMAAESTAITEETVKLESEPDSGVLDVHEDELRELIADALDDPEGLPLMIWGAPGIAKTAIVQAAQKSYGGRLIDLQLTTYAPEDFFLPKEAEETFRRENRFSARATRIPQDWMPVYHETEGEEGNAIANGIDGRGGVLFLDELSRAREAIRNVCLKLVHEKKMDGGWIIGSKWRIIAASNRTFDDPETNASEFGMALSNRFQNYNFVPTIQNLSTYALGLKDEEGKDLIDPRIVSFLNWSNGVEFMHKMDPDKHTIAWPSPRTWIEGAKRWKRKEARIGRKLTGKEIYTILAGHVGVNAADAFLKYLLLSEKIDLDKLPLVYSNPDSAPLPPSRNVGGEQLVEQDVAYIMATAIAYEHRNSRISYEQLENVFKYAVRVNSPTIAMQIIAALTKVHPYINSGLQDPNGMTREFIRLTQQYFLPKYPGESRAMKDLLGGEIPTNRPTNFKRAEAPQDQTDV